MRILILAAVASLLPACGQVRSLTREDRVATSREVAEKEDGAIVTELELARMDMDRTFLCETEPITGSRIPRYQCRSLRRVLREREAAQAIAHASSSEHAGFIVTGESSTNSRLADDLLATNKGRIKKDGDAAPAKAAETLPTPDQDPRFPPL